jgi:hypothetical protein
VGLTLVREDRVGRTSSVRVIPPGVVLGSYVRKGETLNASKRETHLEMSSPWEQSPEGSTQTTSSIGRVWKRGNTFS